MSRAAAFLAFCVALLASAPSWACAVCGSAKAENDWAFGVTTLVLSVLPPILFGTIMFFVVRAYRKAARDENISPPAE